MVRRYLLSVLVAWTAVAVSTLPRRQTAPFLLTKDATVTADTEASFSEVVSRLHYTSQEFNVTTEDGYILSVYRLGSPRCVPRLSPVLLVNGVLLSSDAWLDAGPNASLAFLLAADCRDVWLGNYRGNTHGRAHTTLDPDKDDAFWDYEIEQIARFDLPAMIDFVLDRTGSDQLTYVGFSLGASSFMAACTLRPEINEKVKLFVGLSPPSRVAPSMDKYFVTLVRFGSFVYKNFPHVANWQEVFRSGAGAAALLKELCAFSTVSKGAWRFCERYLELLDSTHRRSLLKATHARLHAHFPGGASAKLLDHFAQLVGGSSFRRYDHGAEKNRQLYGREEAPDFDLGKVTVPSVIFYGLGDTVVPPDTVEWLLRQLPNVVGAEPVSDAGWNHVDMVYSKHFKARVYDTMRKYLEKY